MSNDGTVNFNHRAYGNGQAADVPPNPTVPDAPPPPGSPLDAMYAALVAAANGDDPANDADLQGKHADRKGQYADALGKFPANDAAAAGQLAAPGQESMGQTAAQAIPSIIGAITGAIGGAVGAVTQIPQAVAQAGQSALQAGMGAAQQASSSSADDGSSDAGADDPGIFGDDGYGYDPSGSGGGGGPAGGGGDGDYTGPTSNLGAPAVPVGTFPASAAPTFAPPAPATTTPPAAGPMGGMPMPMGGAGGGGAGTGGDKADTKRVVPPVITNGKPVVGRLIPNRLAAPVVSETSKRTTRQRVSAPTTEGEEKT